MKIADMSLDGLDQFDVDRIKNELDIEASEQYRRVTKSVVLMEKFKPQILGLRRAGQPWQRIAEKIEMLTKISISPTTLRHYFEHNKSANPKNKIVNKTKKSEKELNSEIPNVFAPQQPQIESHFEP